MRAMRTVVLVLSLACAALAAAQSYPTRPISLMVPAPAGGPTDIVGRVIAHMLAEQIGQQVVVENRGGAGNTIGTAVTAKAKPDGYSLVVGSPSALSISPALYKKMPYDAAKDFTPIGMIARTATVLVVHPALPVKTVKEAIALAKARPGEINFASGGNGTLSHLTMELFRLTTDIKVLHVPYKGSGPATTDLLGGQMQMMFHILPLSVPHVRANKLRALAATSVERSPLLPEVPTMEQSGLKGFEVTTWYGLFGPAGMSKEVVQKLNAALAAAVKLPVNARRLNDQGLDPAAGTPEALGAVVVDELAKWGKVVRAAGVTIN
ncbi:MAG: tripartite tricarboxylate transporter substrate binding protein [Burkholderiales bacterium]|nr:tripartite tricarboxylate transporter substrate binding protein [Burkholderiales bacterium]